MTSLKLTIVGDGMVGKSTLFHALIEKEFKEIYKPTIFDDYEHTIQVNGNSYDLLLFDTAGQEDFAKIRTLSYPNVSVDSFIFILL